MPKFEAGSVVEPLDYDFTGKKPDGSRHPNWPKILDKCKGVTPEPSDQQIADFLTGLRDLMREHAGMLEMPAETADVSEMVDALDKLDPSIYVTVMQKMSTLYGGLCSDKPSGDQIAALPPRVRTAFFIYMQEQVVRPEAGSGGGIAPVAALPSARAG